MVEKSGAWYSINGERMGQGRDAAKGFLKENPEMAVKLRQDILDSYGIGKKPLDAAGSEDASEEAMAKTALAAKAAEKKTTKKSKSKA